MTEFRLMEREDSDVRQFLILLEQQSELIIILMGTMETWKCLGKLSRDAERERWIKLMRLIGDENYKNDVPDW